MVVLALSRIPGMMPQNFSAAYAIVFCAGVYLPRGIAWGAALGIMLVIDLVLSLFFYPDFSLKMFVISMAPNYLAYIALIGLGRVLGGKRPWWMLLGGGIVGALIFYVVTNTAAWLQIDYYPKTLAGWIQALTVGTPNWPHTWEFFRSTLLSGGLFTGLFVGAMKLGEASESAREKEAPAKKEEPEGEEAEAV